MQPMSMLKNFILYNDIANLKWYSTYLNNPNLFMKASLVDPYTSEPIHSSDGMPAFIGNCVQSGGTMNYLNES